MRNRGTYNWRRSLVIYLLIGAIALTVCVAICLRNDTRQVHEEPSALRVDSEPKTESKVIGHVDSSQLHQTRRLTATRRDKGRRALEKAVKLPACSQDDCAEAEVLTLPILKGSDSDQELRRVLVPIRDSDEPSFLASLSALMKSDDTKQRLNVLKTIGTVYSGESAPGEADEGDDAALSAEAKRTRDIVGVIRDGLYDMDSSVRAMAIKTSRRIEGDVAGIVASQVMNGNDSDMKLLFLAETAGKATDADMTVSLMGLAAQEEAVRVVAAENLKTLTGVDFKSYEEASAWWEENHIEFLNKAAGVPSNADVSEVRGPMETETDDTATVDDLSTTGKNKNNERNK